MGEKTGIGWTDRTWNPVRGCSKVSEGCANCYAERDNKFRKWTPGWGPGQPRVVGAAAYLKKPLQWNAEAAAEGRRIKVFCASLADWLDNEWPVSARVHLLTMIRQTPNLDWQLLTKRPQNFLPLLEEAADLSDTETRDLVERWLDRVPPQNVWFGVSAENQERADERIPLLLSIPAVIHWISAEPLIGPIDLSYHLNPLFPPKPYGAGIDWVVVGGESGPQARPMLTEWARSLRDQCLLREIPFFFKQWGEHREHVLLTGGWMPNTAEIERALRAGEMDFGGFDDKQRKYLDLGKKLNGRDLDGIEWSQFPEVTR